MNPQRRCGDTGWIGLAAFAGGRVRLASTVEEAAMSTDKTQPNWTTRIIASSAVAIVLVGGLGLFSTVSRDTKSPTADTNTSTAVATSCGGFEADAHKLLDEADTTALTATFAPGDHVHLAVDLNGVGYSWKLSGALANKPKVDGSGWFPAVNLCKTSSTTYTAGLLTATPRASHGYIQGCSKLEMDIDVISAGDGTITFIKTGSESSSTQPKVASASCTVSGTKSLQPMM